MKPFFSIILPTLGKVEQWDEAMQSVVNQTFKGWELIAIDSGPEEASRPIAERHRDSRISYYNTQNGNPRKNWDLGYRKARGEYIIWFEDDNYLLPWALEFLFLAVQQTGAEVVTAEHVHWRGNRHPIAHQRNQLLIGLPLPTNAESAVDSRDVIRRLFGQPMRNPSIKARLHNSETAVKKELADAAIARLGEINFETTSSHALRVAILTLAREVSFLDSIIAIVGQSGEGITETWPYVVSPIMSRATYRYELSPVRTQTYSSYRLENMLLVKRAFEKELRDIPVNVRMFLESHIKELRFSHLTWTSFMRAWREAYRAVSDPAYGAEAAKSAVIRYMLQGVLIKLARHLGFFGIFRRMLESKRRSKKNQYIISLSDQGVRTTAAAAKALPEILNKLGALPKAPTEEEK